MEFFYSKNQADQPYKSADENYNNMNNIDVETFMAQQQAEILRLRQRIEMLERALVNAGIRPFNQEEVEDREEPRQLMVQPQQLPEPERPVVRQNYNAHPERSPKFVVFYSTHDILKMMQEIQSCHQYGPGRRQI